MEQSRGLNDREVANILHALRVYSGGCGYCECDHFDDEGVTPMTPSEVDALCERINFEGLWFGSQAHPVGSDAQENTETEGR
jgi:hypothetical protein